ncbi:hypothetical protein AB4Y64_07100 [Lysobacter sp. TAF61]|uniref:hypothetical protein n=1 Tax=Lysobacter sp. TAF61 TaxID=3233072 RepID=UPI003F96EED7
MNAFTRTPTVPATATRSNVVPMPQRHVHRERDFGVGYGNSSGYASNRRYAQDWMQPRFRCA